MNEQVQGIEIRNEDHAEAIRLRSALYAIAIGQGKDPKESWERAVEIAGRALDES